MNRNTLNEDSIKGAVDGMDNALAGLDLDPTHKVLSSRLPRTQYDLSQRPSIDLMPKLTAIATHLNSTKPALWVFAFAQLIELLRPTTNPAVSETPSPFELQQSGVSASLLHYLTEPDRREIRLWILYRVRFLFPQTIYHLFLMAFICSFLQFPQTKCNFCNKRLVLAASHRTIYSNWRYRGNFLLFLSSTFQAVRWFSSSGSFTRHVTALSKCYLKLLLTGNPSWSGYLITFRGWLFPSLWWIISVNFQPILYSSDFCDSDSIYNTKCQ